MIAWIALGSNRGDRALMLQLALARMPAIGVSVHRVSQFRETAPQGATGRRHFLNAVAEIETDLSPRLLLRRLQGLERNLGRHRAGKYRSRKTPRTLDLDIVFFGRVRMHTPQLTLPHSGWRQREFVLNGLRELGRI